MDTISTIDGTGGITGRGQITQEDGGELKAPKSIIMNVSAARTYYNQYRAAHIERIQLYAAIEGLIAGNPPYDSEKLAAAGLSHIANVNTLDAKGLFEKAALTFWNLVHQTENFVKFTLRPFEIQDDPVWSDWEEILSRNWTKVIKEMWPDFLTQSNTLTGQLVKLGLSPIIWPNEDDFRWKTVELNRFFVADNTAAASGQWDCICIDTDFTVQMLWEIYEEYKDKTPEEQGEETPWNIELLGEYLLQKANSGNKGGGFQDLYAAQVAMQNGDLNSASFFSDSVRLTSLLYKEYSGKISHFIFDPRTSGIPGANDFLFKIIDQYNDWREVINIYTYSPHEFKLHGNRGVGHKIFPICQGIMQLDCNMLDMGKLAATPMVSTQAGAGKDLAPIRIIHGVVTDIGQAVLQQNNLGSNIGQLVQLAQYFENKVNKNAVIGGDDPGVPDAASGSKSSNEITTQSLKEFGVGKQNVNHFYSYQDVTVTNMTAILLHSKDGDASYDVFKEWKTLCEEEGVPKQVFEIKDAEKGKLPRHLSVRAARVAGDGSNLGLVMGLKGIGGIAGGFNVKGQYNYRKDIVASQLGIDYVTRYLSDSTVPDEEGAGASLAFLENLAIKQGAMPQCVKDNPHKTHIGTHAALINEIIQAVQSQKMNPVDADKQFALAIPHTDEHLTFISQDELNQEWVKGFKPTWQSIKKFAQLNRVKAQKMQQTEVRRRQEAEQQLSAEQLDQQRKDMVVERDSARKDFLAQKKEARADDQSTRKGETMAKATDAKIENERRLTESKINNEKKKSNKPEDIFAGQTTAELQSSLESQVGRTANPADFV
jgi:hypothetical protein